MPFHMCCASAAPTMVRATSRYKYETNLCAWPRGERVRAQGTVRPTCHIGLPQALGCSASSPCRPIPARIAPGWCRPVLSAQASGGHRLDAAQPSLQQRHNGRGQGYELPMIGHNHHCRYSYRQPTGPKQAGRHVRTPARARPTCHIGDRPISAAPQRRACMCVSGGTTSCGSRDSGPATKHCATAVRRPSYVSTCVHAARAPPVGFCGVRVCACTTLTGRQKPRSSAQHAPAGLQGVLFHQMPLRLTSTSCSTKPCCLCSFLRSLLRASRYSTPCTRGGAPGGAGPGKRGGASALASRVAKPGHAQRAARRVRPTHSRAAACCAGGQTAHSPPRDLKYILMLGSTTTAGSCDSTSMSSL